MADNYTFADFSAASKTAAADDVGGVLIPRAKIVAGANNENLGDVGGTVVESSRVALYTRERGSYAILQPTITGSTTPAYTAGDNVGGLLTIASVVPTAGDAIRVTGITLSSLVNPTGFDVYLLRDTPGGTYTDNAVNTILAADRAKTVSMLTGTATVKGGTYWTEFGPSNSAYLPEFTLVGTSLYMLVAFTGTPTLAATTDTKLSVFYEKL